MGPENDPWCRQQWKAMESMADSQRLQAIVTPPLPKGPKNILWTKCNLIESAIVSSLWICEIGLFEKKKNTFVVGSSTSIWSRRGPSDSCSFCVKFKRHNIWTFENILNNISYNHIRICLMFFSSNSRAFSAAAFLWLSTLKSEGRESRNIW